MVTRAKTGQKKPRRKRRQISELPPPLPPETRTIGQLIAEALRLYARRFWPSVALGIVPAGVAIASEELPRTIWTWSVIAIVPAFLLSAVYIGACVITLDIKPTRSRLLTAYVMGVIAWLPLYVFSFALLGLAVPAVLVEGRGGWDALRRGFNLARADLAHSLGGIAGLLVTWWVTSTVMTMLLRAGSQQTLQIAAALSVLVVSPVFFLGSALLYQDQAARVSSRRQSTRSRHAALPDAVDPD